MSEFQAAMLACAIVLGVGVATLVAVYVWHRDRA